MKFTVTINILICIFIYMETNVYLYNVETNSDPFRNIDGIGYFDTHII